MKKSELKQLIKECILEATDYFSSDYELVMQYPNNDVFLKQGDKYNNSNTDLLFELAFCYEQLIQTSEAIEVYNRIINIDSFLPEAWFNLGQVYFVLEDYAKALTAYDFVMAINENDSLACLQKAHAHFQLEQYPQQL